MTNAFESLGFLSPDLDMLRHTERARLAAEFANLEHTMSVAIEECRQVSGITSENYFVGAAFWLRCIESCQATVLLGERGLSTTSYATLRTAFECLFAACALWRDPAVAGRMEAWHHKERIKQAKGMLAAGAETRVSPAELAALRAISSDVSPPCDWSHQAAANIAELRFEYETAYRGLGLAGAHATPRSLDDYHFVQPDDSLTLRFEQTTTRLEWVLGLVNTCLVRGIQRHRDARGNSGGLRTTELPKATHA